MERARLLRCVHVAVLLSVCLSLSTADEASDGVANANCTVPSCTVICPDGQYAKDSNECPTCECLDPCHNVQCPSGLHCVLATEFGTIFGRCAVKCPVQTCLESCPYNQFVRDENNCTACTCYDPCKDVQCPEGETCDGDQKKCVEQDPSQNQHSSNVNPDSGSSPTAQNYSATETKTSNNSGAVKDFENTDTKDSDSRDTEADSKDAAVDSKDVNSNDTNAHSTDVESKGTAIDQKDEELDMKDADVKDPKDSEKVPKETDQETKAESKENRGSTDEVKINPKSNLEDLNSGYEKPGIHQPETTSTKKKKVPTATLR